MSNNYYSRTSNPQTNSAGSSSLIRAEFALLEAGFDKLPTLTANGDEVVVVNAGATALETVPRATLIDATVVAATSKTTPVDADLIPLVDSAASNVLKKLTWANVKATLLTWLQGTVLPSPGAIGGTTPSTGAFTTLSATGQVTTTATGDAIRVSAGGRNAYLACDSAGFTLVTGAGQTGSGIYAKASDNTLQLWANATAIATVSSTGLAVTGTLSATGQTTVENSADSTQYLLRLRNSSAGTAAVTGLSMGFNGGYNGLNLRKYSSAHATRPNYCDVMNEQNAPLVLGSNGADVVSITSTGLAVTGLLDISNAASGQIKFPATQVPSADANTLDDYEEGNWTPVIAGSTVAGAGTYTAQTGRYTKKGREVTCLATIGWSAHTGTGNMLLTGLPFTAESGINPQSAASCATLTITGQLFLEVGQSTAGGSFFVVNNGVLSSLAMDSAANVYLQFTYNV